MPVQLPEIWESIEELLPLHGASEMALSGNTRDLTLAELILVESQDPGSYRVGITGPAGDGIVLLEGGRVVHAVYGQLPAEDAARADGYRGSRLRALAVRTLAELGARLRETGDRVRITGHSEPTELTPSEPPLSEARASAVADFLRGEDLAPERIESEGRGADEPRVSNLTLAGRRENRRADVWLLVR